MKKGMGQKLAVICGIGGLLLLLLGGTWLYRQLSAGYGGVSLSGESAQGNTEALSEGSQEAETVPAPDITFCDGEGKEVALSSFFGKPIVLNFWGTWCGYCKEELPGFLAAEREYGDQVQFLYLNYEQGASLEDSKKKTGEYLSQEGLEMTSYYDFQQDGVMTYGVYSFPTTFFIDGDGNVLAYQPGYLSQENLTNAIEQLFFQ